MNEMNLKQRINALEARINPAGSWGDRVTLQEKIDRWQAAEGQGLELDFRTGDFITLAELRRLDPVWADLIETNTAQFTEALDFYSENVDSNKRKDNP
jgi:hypothetical protein